MISVFVYYKVQTMQKYQLKFFIRPNSNRFPLTNPELLAKWIKFTDRGLNWRPSRWSSICSRHFDSSDFREYLSRKCLKKTAIPTIVTKNNISYETYQICENNSCENTRTMHSELDDDLAVAAMEQSQHNEKSESEAIENCRLCGERGDEHLLSNSNPTATLDDHEIDAMFRKCLPTVSIHSDVDQSRAVCVDCVSQLRQYSDFIDKVLSYQRDLDLQSNNDSFISTENILRGKGINFCPKNQTSSTADATMFIKQEPINVKQEIFDNSTKKQNGFEFTTQILTPPAASAIVTSAATGIDSKKQINVVQQEIRLPNADIDMTTYCRLCDRIFGSNFEFKMHNCCAHSFNNDSQEPQNSNANNNCEIMEIITLNNPVSFIDLAEDDNNAANCEINQLKMENNVDAERRERVERDHAYAKRMTSTPCQMKQEIVEGNYSDLEFSFAESEAHSTVLENEDQNTCSLDASISQISQPIGNTEVACPKCNQMFASQQLIEEHTQSMHTLKNKICSICSAEFKSVYDFLLHKNKMHSVQCKQCKQKFSTSLALKKHERQCTSESTDFCYSCRHCGKRIKNLIKMKEHLRICTEKPNPSEGNSLSNVSFQNDATVNKRMSLQKFICDICYRTFSRLKYFVRTQYHLCMIICL